MMNLPTTLLVTFLGIDPLLTVYAVLAFNIIGVSLAAMILFTRAKFITSEDCTLTINNDPELEKHVQGGGPLLAALVGS
jgi:Na+-transporting NADH:ubiquinone oxidoreductase subunit F